ncbi:Down syndrome cell adhesion molecule-like protein, partial [Dinothrombium tinctorium]
MAHSVIFISTYGTIIPCHVQNRDSETFPQLKVWWQTLQSTNEFVNVTNIPRLRLIRSSDGLLALMPFNESDFRPDVHDAYYRCVVSYKCGVIASHWIKVKAVVEKPIDVRVYDETVNFGGDVILRCAFSEDFLHVSGWMTDDGFIFLPPSIALNSIEETAEQKHWVLSTGDLFISNIDEKDVKRRYRCQVRNHITGERSESLGWARLNAVERLSQMKTSYIHQPVLSDSVFVVNEGSTFLIVCSFDGNPKPAVHWYRYQRKADNSDLNDIQLQPLITTNFRRSFPNLLFIPRISSEDSGKFVCLANNSYGQSRYEINVRVKSSLKLILYSSNANPTVGEDVTLNCSFDDVFSILEQTTKSFYREVIWVRDTHRLSFGHRLRLISENVIQIRSFRYVDNGIYQCFVRIMHTNGDNEQWFQSASLLQIKEKAPMFATVFSEQIKIANVDLSLKCMAHGQPLPKITWKIDGIDILNSRRHRVHSYTDSDSRSTISFLNISSLSSHDGGFYECIASNNIGEVSHKARINIIGPPIVSPLTNVTAVIGDPFTLHCPFSGYPVEELLFFRENRRLDSDTRHSLLGMGKMRMTALSKEDSGIYKCVASNLNGDRSEGSIILKVLAAPVLSPFLFANNLEEGMRTSVLCSVIAGDPPITIDWFKDGIPLNSVLNLKFQIVALNEFVTSLTVSKVDRHYSGNYTCKASNHIASANYTATLQVKSKPMWTLKPIRRSAVSGMSIVFDCKADGYPQPVIRWKYNLLVFDPPKVRALNNLTVIRRAERTEIGCQASGSQPLNFVWTKSDTLVESNNHFTVREDVSDGIKISFLSINLSTRNDSGIFTCTATSFYGVDKARITVMVQEPPDAPQDFRALEIGSRKVLFSWSLPFTGNARITGYEMQYKLNSESWLEAKKHSIIEPTTNSIEIDNLRPMVKYKFRVKAKNVIGDSVYSDDIELITKMEAPEVVPLNLTASATGSRSVKISWIISNSIGSHFIEGFSIGYRRIETRDAYIYNTMHAAIKTEGKNGSRQQDSSNFPRRFEYTVDKLEKATKYSIVVQAFNSMGTGPYSDEVTVETFANDPPKAPLLKVDSITTKSVYLSWSILNDDDESSIHGFNLYYRQESSFESEDNHLHWKMTRLPSNQRKHKLLDLKCGTRYSAKISGFNEIGNGELSSEIKFNTNGRAPIAADKHSFIRSNITFAILVLNAWGDGNCPISHFNVRYKPRLQPDWITFSSNIVPVQRTVIIRDLNPGTWYDLAVTVSNDAGETEATYLFATLTKTGATVAPLSLTENRSFFDSLLVLIPSISALLVLFIVGGVATYIFFLRLRNDDSHSETYGRQGTDSVSLNSYNKVAKSEAFYDQRTQVFYPSVYGTPANERCLQQQHTDCTPSEYGFPIDSQMMRKSGHEHVYDIPHRKGSSCNQQNENCSGAHSFVWIKSNSNDLFSKNAKNDGR